MPPPLTAQQTLERARSVLESGRGAALPELLKLIETLSLNLAEVTVSELAELIEKDAVVLTRVIAVANTLAHNPGIAPLATLSQAIHQIGYNRIRTIAVSLMLLETAGASNSPEQREAAAIALGAGLVAHGLAASRGTHDPELAFACAALRNFGRIIMAAASPEHAREAVRRARTVPDADAHRAVFGLTPVDLSRQLLARGRLPDEVLRTLRDYDPESLGGTASTFDSRLIGLTDLGGRLALLALDARDGPEAFKRKAAELYRRFARIVPDAAEHAKPALLHADQRLASFARCNGIRTLPTLSLGRFRRRLDDLLPAGARAAETEIETALHSEPHTLPAATLIPPADATIHDEPPLRTDPRPPLPISPSDSSAAAAAEPPAPTAPWDRELVASSVFHARPLESAPPDPWHAALTAARDTAKATLCSAFLPSPDGLSYSLAQRSEWPVAASQRAAATSHTGERSVFGVCLSRLEIVVIHDTRDRSISPYLPVWWREFPHAPGAFALIPVRDGAFVRALLLIGWPEPRRISLTSEQVAVLDQLARSALGATAPAGAPFAA